MPGERHAPVGKSDFSANTQCVPGVYPLPECATCSSFAMTPPMAKPASIVRGIAAFGSARVHARVRPAPSQFTEVPFWNGPALDTRASCFDHPPL